MNKLKLEDYLEGGYSMEKAEKLTELFNQENTASTIISSVAMTIAIGVCILLFFILTLTSLHNLIKKKKDRGTLTYPETGQRLY